MFAKKAFLVTLVVFLTGALYSSALATTQERDLIVFEGARYYTYSLPSLAECLPGIKLPDFRMLTTANYKGYRATWAVIDSQLFLIGVEGKVQQNEGRRMLSSHELFLKLTFPHKVTSFSGQIELKGRSLDYEIRGNTIIYTDKIVLQFKNGKVVKVSRTTHDKRRK